ncbi:MAG TPA: phosphatidylglycerophosphatase A [Syntrophales bacterium]|nr:phosphatidylglycerophosphatase A [Syntrophales bacterium]
MTKIAATALGAGYCPVAPGTAGTVVAVPIYLVLIHQPRWLYVLTVVTATVLACRVADRAEALFGRRDPPQIVIDEVVGYLWTMVAIAPSWASVVAGFFVFRLLDILKPFPVDWAQRRLPGGVGVVMDDVAAGLYGALTLMILVLLGVLPS